VFTVYDLCELPYNSVILFLHENQQICCLCLIHHHMFTRNLRASGDVKNAGLVQNVVEMNEVLVMYE